MRTRGNAVSSRRARMVAGVALVASLALGVAACSSDGGSDDATPGPGGTKPTPSPATAPPEITAVMHDAVSAVTSAPSYQVLANVVADGKTTNVFVDVVGPDRVHESVIDPDGALTETLVIGSQAWTKIEQEPWVPAADVPRLFLDTPALFRALTQATAVSGSDAGVVFRLPDDSSYYDAVDAADLAGTLDYVDGRIVRVRYGGSFAGTSRLITFDLSVPGSTTSIEAPT